MGADLYVFGVRPPDEQWQRMKAVYDACTNAGIAPPREVEDFFDGDPDEAGILINLLGEGHPAVTEYRSDHELGYVIELARLPSNITHLRVVESW